MNKKHYKFIKIRCWLFDMKYFLWLLLVGPSFRSKFILQIFY